MTTMPTTRRINGIEVLRTVAGLLSFIVNTIVALEALIGFGKFVWSRLSKCRRSIGFVDKHRTKTAQTGRPISRREALRMSEKALEDAERRRKEYAKQQASKSESFGEEGFSHWPFTDR
jgi:hypothetical protein